SEGQQPGFGHDHFPVATRSPQPLRRCSCSIRPLRSQTKEGVGIDGRSLRNDTAFSAVAPPQRPVCDAHQSKIFGRGISIMSPGPNIWTLNIRPLGQFRPHLGFSVSPIHIAQQCGPFATYRRVSCLSASTICGCITAHRSDDWRAEPTRATLRSGFHSPLPVLYRFGGLIMTIASLKSSQKATATREVLASNDVRPLIANQLGVDVKHVTDEAHFTGPRLARAVDAAEQQEGCEE